ncbi:MAG TPA: VC0807 family protein [Roseiflexaceae bacterium]|nr:VC0807 family protein [Roseiflexaceae bacterium]HMP40830.1 VC0807 family protein [Roseiflexaceae bacterium]
MNRTTKLILDIVMGAVIPILILNYLTDPLGAPAAYVFSALVPVGWIFFDLFFLTRRFNFITAYIGLTAIVRGALAFWFVDGLLFAIKDTAGGIISTFIFAGSLAMRWPVMYYFVHQATNPDTAAREQSLTTLLREPGVFRGLQVGTLIVLVANILTSIANFFLNLYIVVAPFGTEAFNLQVAQVNAITRIALTIPEFIGFFVAIWLVYRELYRLLPAEEGKEKIESDFWELVQRHEQAQAES